MFLNTDVLNFLSRITASLLSSEDPRPAGQNALTLNQPTKSSGSARLALEQPFTLDPQFFAPLTIGTPPQPLSFLLDLSPISTVVAVSDCTSCCASSRYFNRSQSATYHRARGSPPRTGNGYIQYSGIEAYDTFHVGDLRVPDHVFVDTGRRGSLSCVNPEHECYEGLLSLAPYGPSSLLVHLAEAGILDRNVFGLRLREPMELSFGIVDLSFTNTNTNTKSNSNELIRVPLTNNTGPGLTGHWQTSAYSISIDGGGAHFDLSSTTAVFSTQSALIRLPIAIVIPLLRALDFTGLDDGHNPNSMPPHVPCSKRDSMPSVTFNLGGQDLALTAYDYTLEFAVEEGSTICISAIAPLNWGEGIELGSAFLRAFYSVFDLDGEAIGFSPLRT